MNKKCICEKQLRSKKNFGKNLKYKDYKLTDILSVLKINTFR